MPPSLFTLRGVWSLTQVFACMLLSAKESHTLQIAGRINCVEQACFPSVKHLRLYSVTPTNFEQPLAIFFPNLITLSMTQ